MTVQLATPKNLREILFLFDEAQQWLIEMGIAEQWGTEPFSVSQRERFTQWIEKDIFYVLKDNNSIIGSIVMNPKVPEYSDKACEGRPLPMFYLEAFVTHPIYRGKSLGNLLLSFVEDKARAQNIDWLRLDCWSGNPRLRSYYLKQGFTEFGQCQLGSWQGTLFEKCLIVSSDSV